jgi:hypothetical protein
MFSRIVLNKFDDKTEQSSDDNSNSAFELFKFIIEKMKDDEQKIEYEAILNKIKQIDIKRSLKYDILPFLPSQAKNNENIKKKVNFFYCRFTEINKEKLLKI